jgi:hypothetical protein
MKRVGKKKSDELYLVAFGKNLERLIKKAGYKSSYEFWIERAGDELSRSALNYILAGATDAKLSTLRAIAKMLDTDICTLCDFEA